MQKLKVIHVDKGSWIDRYLTLADHISTWSRDPSSKFGCILTNNQNRNLGFGYNGFPSGFEDTPERWNDRDFKIKHVIHAEENAILNSNSSSLINSTAYVTGCPCSGCMGKLAQVGVKKIFAYQPTDDYLTRWSVSDPLAIAKECGVDITFVSRHN